MDKTVCRRYHGKTFINIKPTIFPKASHNASGFATIGLAEYELQVNFFQAVEPDQQPLSKQQLFPVSGRSFAHDGANRLQK
jgi:hypothetical protein